MTIRNIYVTYRTPCFTQHTFTKTLKSATIIPIRKKYKPSEDPSESYRPISHTSCLGKIMERIINRRISWTLEKNGQRHKTQAGFHKGRSTMDDIISLDHFKRRGFNHLSPTNTNALFLNVSKAFDTTWIQLGLLIKLSNKLAPKSSIQRKNRPNIIQRPRILSRGAARVRLGLSPLLFTIVMDDFLIFLDSGAGLFVADDIECHVYASNGKQVESK